MDSSARAVMVIVQNGPESISSLLLLFLLASVATSLLLQILEQLFHHLLWSIPPQDLKHLLVTDWVFLHLKHLQLLVLELSHGSNGFQLVVGHVEVCQRPLGEPDALVNARETVVGDRNGVD